MPWKKCHKMDEKLKFVSRFLDERLRFLRSRIDTGNASTRAYFLSVVPAFSGKSWSIKCAATTDVAGPSPGEIASAETFIRE